MKVGRLGEFGLIERIRKATGVPRLPTLLGIGDDAALLAPPPGFSVAVTTDMLLEGVHFLRERTHPADLGYKSLAVNLSDLAAMGSRPVQAYLCLGLPEETEVEEVDEFLTGFQQASGEDTILAGGDTVASKDGWTISVTAVGLVEEGRELRRDGARAGDVLFLSGCVGDSAAGLEILLGKLRLRDEAKAEELVLAHNRPPAEVALGRFLVRSGHCRCAIDVSDGLLQDLGHICESSDVGAEVRLESVPLSRTLMAAARESGRVPLNWALSGGEDYRLLFTVPRDRADAVRRQAEEQSHPVHPIGEIRAGEGIVLTLRGRPVPAPGRKGYEHFSR